MYQEDAVLTKQKLEDLNKELEEVINLTPLKVKEFPVTSDQVGCNLAYCQNTVREYLWRYVTLCCFGGFVIEYKYKHRHHLKDEVWVNKWIEMFKKWREAGIVEPVIFGSGVMRLDLDLLDKERGQVIQLLEGNKMRVTNIATGLVITKEACIVHMQRYGDGHDLPIELKKDWTASENLKHEYTEEEIDNLIVRTCYMMWMFPSHEVNQKISRINENRRLAGSSMKSMVSDEILNDLTGNNWFVSEGSIPEVVFQLEVPAQERNWEEEAIKRRIML